jgi:proteasome assembly chaperone (PAC2) family protein
MGIKLHQDPEMRETVLFCGWPGIGNIGLIAIDTLQGALRASAFGEIEPWDFFAPRKVVIANGLLGELEFPRNRFYHQRVNDQDVMFFIGEEQAGGGRAGYGEGKKAYELANLVLDVAEKYGCRRVFTSGAAVAQIHHTTKPRVWAVPNHPRLMEEIRNYDNTILMSEIAGRGGQGSITGLNGLMLGVARQRGLEAICIMGEIPYYLQGAPWPYPKASLSILKLISQMLNVRMKFPQLEKLAQKVEVNVERFLEQLFSIAELPVQVKEEIERLQRAPQDNLGPITEDEQQRIMDHIDELFNQERGKDDRAI